MPLQTQDGDGTIRDMTPEEEAAFMDGRPTPESKRLALQPISRRQFYQGIAQPPFSIITEQEALDAIAKKSLPAQIEVAISNLPPEDQFAARCAALGNDVFDRDDMLVEEVRISKDPAYTHDEVDAIWLECAKL